MPRQLDETLLDELAAREERMIELRRELHRFPEPSFKERRTSTLIAERLHAAGLEVRPGPLPTSVIGVLRGDRPGRTVAWRADIDALPIQEPADKPFASQNPGIMHACGHDGHTAIALTLAEAMAARRATLPGTAVFVFQPAEEVFGGAMPMIQGGVLDEPGIERIYGLHLDSDLPVGRVYVQPGPAMASADFFTIAIQGRGGHGASPHRTVDPIIVAAELVTSLQTLVAREVDASETAVLTIGELHAGSSHNIIPESAVLRGSLRTFSETWRPHIIERIRAMSSSVAQAFRASASLTIDRSCPTLENDSDEARCAHAWLTQGHADVAWGGRVMASDDMSLFLQARKGCYLRVGARLEDGALHPHHSAAFDMDERSLGMAARAALIVVSQSLLADLPPGSAAPGSGP